MDDHTDDSPPTGDALIPDRILDPVRYPIDRDWWRCYRRAPVSGRYYGPAQSGKAKSLELDLRVDIDPRFADSPVMMKISGDFYHVYTFGFPYRYRRKVKLYKESWIVDDLKVSWNRCHVMIYGKVRFWSGSHPYTEVTVKVPWSAFSGPGPAEVSFATTSGVQMTFECAKRSENYRDIVLEVDACSSINAAPLVPSYDTHAHSNRPASTRQRTLTIEEAYHEAGVGVEINPTTTIIDDSDPAFNTWSVAELHDAMGTHFSRFPGSWPKWHMWGLLAGSFVSSGTGGIMFDARAAYGGAGEAPERQGFAVFRNHSWFNNLKDGAPANQAEAWAMRHFLYTWVHEAGHAFNFLHSWDKSRADSLSWMNYDWKYNSLDSGNDYWRDFEFRFDDEELIHMRHGDRASVIMGGDQWASGGHMDMPADAFSKTMGEAPVELLLRGKGYYEFLSPVSIEVRLRNRLDDMDLELDRRFDPTFGCVKYMIRKPDGKTVLYEPIACQVGDPDLVKLQGAKAAKNGEDRYSQNVYLQYGSGGFYFDVPGDYLVRAIYSGAGEMILTSNTLKLRVGTPLTRREDIVAQDFFSRDVGMCLCLGGSKSRFLTKGMETLEGIMEEFKSTAMQAKIVSMIVGSVGAPFFGIKDPEKLRQIEKLHDGDPKAALAMSKNAMEFYHKEGGGDDNIDYGLLVCQRVRLHKEVGDDKSAKAEGDSLVNDLSSRGVHPPVVKAIQKDMSGK